MCHSHATVRGLLEQLVADSDQITVLDTEASLEHLTRGTARHVDVMLIVVEPYYRSLQTAITIHTLATELGVAQVYAVANKVRDAGDAEAIRAFCQTHHLSCIETIPYDTTIVEADRQGVAPFDYDGGSEAIARIERLGRDLLQKRGAV